MGFEYSAFNPMAWGLLVCFAVLVHLIERLFRAKNPGYPGRVPGQGLEEAEGE
jgi:hypothetical protein